MDEVNESITYICIINKIYRQIQEVVLSLVVFVDFVQQCCLNIFIRDVFYHDCSSSVISSFNIFYV